ncbi:hypothetical protein ACHAXR_011592 [Thalassiosira sp. AJA248-18]
MVVPSLASKKSRKRQRNKDILVVIAVTTIAVGGAWIFTLSLLDRPSSSGVRGFKADSFNAPAMDAVGDPDGAVEEVLDEEVVALDETHLSAANMLATKHPYLMYGTAWKKEETANFVFQAVSSGFRFIDTACQPKHYDESGVGYGWKLAADELGLSREDLFLQTKFTAMDGQDKTNVPYDVYAELEAQVRQSVQASLTNLKIDYIDSLVLHSPMKTMKETMRVWKVLESLVYDGKIRQLGISNCYDRLKFEQLYDKATIKPTVLQNRFYKDSNFDIELRSMCKSLGVQYQSFWTLSANRHVFTNPDWKHIANEKGLTPQTLMYAFMMTLGHTPLSGTKDEGHMKQDVDLMLRFQRGETVLNEEEMKRMSSLLGIGN